MKNRILTVWAVAGTLALGVVSCVERETEVATYENNYEQTLVQDDSASVQINHSIEYYKSFKGGGRFAIRSTTRLSEAASGRNMPG